MKILLDRGSLTISPETVFEREWLEGREVYSVFHSYGESEDYLGLTVELREEAQGDRRCVVKK